MSSSKPLRVVALLLGFVAVCGCQAGVSEAPPDRAAGVVPAPPPPPAPPQLEDTGWEGLEAALPPPQVAVIGDSLTNLSREELVAALGPEVEPIVIAANAHTTAEMQSYLDFLLASEEGPPDRLVINLGTNDALRGNQTALADYEAMLAKLDGVDCIVLTTVAELTDLFVPPISAVAARLNTRILLAPWVDPRVQVAGWNGAVGQPDGAAWLDADAIHPNQAGQRELAELIASTLARCPGGAGASPGVDVAGAGS